MLGALYLAYDLLGGEHRPLWTLTRGVTCGILVRIGMSAIRAAAPGAGYVYGTVFGAIFGALSTACQILAYKPEWSRTYEQTRYPPALRRTRESALLLLEPVHAHPMLNRRRDHMPQKRMGVLGIVLILAGFGLQFVQYWVALPRVSVSK